MIQEPMKNNIIFLCIAFAPCLTLQLICSRHYEDFYTEEIYENDSQGKNSSYAFWRTVPNFETIKTHIVHNYESYYDHIARYSFPVLLSIMLMKSSLVQKIIIKIRMNGYVQGIFGDSEKYFYYQMEALNKQTKCSACKQLLPPQSRPAGRGQFYGFVGTNDTPRSKLNPSPYFNLS
jgi:hypothetical protein